ncbi:MAG: DUF4157 domain-containing protein [Bacteroidota bacterium]
MYTHTDPLNDHDNRSAAETTSHSSAEGSLQAPPLSLKASPLQRMGSEEEEELQMKRNPLQRMGEEEELQMKANPLQRMGGEEEEEELQMKANPLQRKENGVSIDNGGGASMPAAVQSQMETSMGSDFSSVRIHPNSSAAPEVGAQAFTQGDHIHFDSGKYDPASQQGQELLGHELAHVVQQREGRVQPTTEVNGVSVNDEVGLEREADEMGRSASQLKKEQ